MLQAIVGTVGGFIFGALLAVLLASTVVRAGSSNESLFFAGLIGGGALSGPCAVIGATSAILNAMRARARGHID